MTLGRDTGRVGLEESYRPTHLELFFDLVYVFVFAEIVSREVRRLELRQGTTGLAELLGESGKLVVLLLAMWFVWWNTAWTTSRYDPKRSKIQLLVILTIFGTLVMALTLPRAFRPYGYLFASAYVLTQMARTAVLMWVLHGERRRLEVRMLLYYCVAAAPWIAGASFTGWQRGTLWLSALAIEFVGSQLAWPIPGLGRAPANEASVLAGEHLGERYQQFFLIALGESILATGLTLSEHGFDTGPVLAFALSTITTILLWRIYFQRAGLILTEAIAKAPRPDRMGQSVAISHFAMIAGVVITSIGYQLVLAFPYGHTEDWLIVVAGPVLFLAGRARFEYEVFRRVSWSRWVAIAVLIALTPALRRTPELVDATCVAAVFGGVAAVDTLRSRKRRDEPPSPAPLGLGRGSLPDTVVRVGDEGGAAAVGGPSRARPPQSPARGS